MINSRISEEEVLNSFEDINLQTKEEIPDAPKNDEKVEDLLGQPSGKFDYKVFYSKPPSYDIPIESIIPGGWGDEFDDQPASKEDKKTEDTTQPQKKEKEEIMPSDSLEPLSSKETCMVEIWKDEVIETITKEMQEQPVCLTPEEELSLDLTSVAFRT